ECKGEANVQVTMERSTLGARSAVVRLGEVGEETSADPGLIQTRDCAFLQPFAGTPAPKAGLLVSRGESLSRGGRLGQGARGAVDGRFWFMAKQADAAPPEKGEGSAAWRRLWGSSGSRSQRHDVGGLAAFAPGRWELERLFIGKEAAGADLEKLGI